MSARPKFREQTCLNGQHIATPLETKDGIFFKPILSCRAYFTVEFFQIAFLTIVNHPEYNSSLILRSETLCDDDSTTRTHVSSELDSAGFTAAELEREHVCELRDHIITRTIRRKLLPRRPARDSSLEQNCVLFQSLIDLHPTVGVLTPQLLPDHILPYYHPQVSHLAFRYVSCKSDVDKSLNLSGESHHLVIEIIPLDDTPIMIDISSRLYRTCLALLETIDRYGWGAANNYRKRVIHDVIVPRDEYQDLYLVMKERHKPLVEGWQESTDPCKHVFEDVGIATFLMLLWKMTYKYVDPQSRDPDRPWTQWPRPPEGFVDLGCGNGVLAHILLSEGYKGEGIDIRARHSWSHFPQTTRRHLHVETFNPLVDLSPRLRSSVFIIGNHADELTAWVPVISSIVNASGYLSVPCCPWDFDSRYERGGRGAAFSFPRFDPKGVQHQEFVSSLGFGEAQGDTSYSKYRIWLAYLSRACGWKVECEMLRIPSTRNWAIIGRSRENETEGLEISRSIVRAVKKRGMFTPRKPEGKNH